MLSNITKLEIKIGEKVFQFTCDVDSPIGAVHDALTAFKSFVVGKINEAEAAQNAAPKPDIVPPPEAS